MKILQVTNLFAPIHGGVAEATYQCAKHLQGKGHEVTVWTSNYKKTDDYIGRYITRSFNTELCFANLHITFGMIAQAEFIKGYDVIHLNNLRTFQNIVVSHYAKKYGIPYVLQAHGGVMPTFQKQGLKRLFDTAFGNRILRGAYAVIAGNADEALEYEMMGVPDYKIVIIPPFYDTTEYDNLPKRRTLPYHIIAFMGRIHEIKGLESLVDAFYLLKQKRGDIVLQIIGGDGGYLKTLMEQIKRLGLENDVQFTGLLRGKEKLQALVDVDMLVQPSIYERGAGSPFEAILCNTPIIVTSNTGAGNAVAQIDAGYLVKHGDISELALLMNRVLNDPVEIQTKTARANQYIRSNLSWAKGVEQYEELYTKRPHGDMRCYTE
jgi:glycosyltransferase involved in cell wall biosynthesis